MLLSRLIQRGDLVEIRQGRLTITPASGKPVCQDWLEDNKESLIRDILNSCERSGFRFVRLEKADHFGSGRFPGAKLAFVDLMTGEQRIAFFRTQPQVYERATRKHKAGDRLPAGRFTVAEGSLLARLWLSTGMILPKLSELHRRLGNLSGFVFECDLAAGKGDRAVAGSLRPMNITAQEIANSVDKPSTSRRQAVDKPSTRIVDKETQQRPVLDSANGDFKRRPEKAQNKEQVNRKELLALKAFASEKDSSEGVGSFHRSRDTQQNDPDDFDLGDDPFMDAPRNLELVIVEPDWWQKRA